MKRFLFICLLVCFTCNEVIDAGKCLLNIPGYKEAVEEVMKAMEDKNYNEKIMIIMNFLGKAKDSAIDCINKMHNVEGLICKHPLRHIQCLFDCGLPDSSPRYCKCHSACRTELCL